MKKLFLLVLSLLPSLIFSQKVKVKKEVVLLDKQPIAHLVVLGNEYHFSNLNQKNKPLFTVRYNDLEINEHITKRWLTISNADGSQRTQVDMDYLSLTLNLKKALAELMVKKYGILTEKGIDNAALKTFLTVSRPDLNQYYHRLVGIEVQKQLDRVNAIAQLNIHVDTELQWIFKAMAPYDIYSEDEYIFVQNDYHQIVGTYTLHPTDRIISLYDLDGQKVAVATINLSDRVVVTLPYFENQFTYESSNSWIDYDRDEAPFIIELVSELHFRGIYLGYQMRDNAIPSHSAQFQQNHYESTMAKKTSINLYDTPGYIINQNGEKFIGHLTVLWEYDSNTEETDLLYSDDVYLGQKIVVRLNNETNKKEYRDFFSREGIRFCVFLPGGEKECYTSILLEDEKDTLATTMTAKPKLDTSRYMKIIEENKGIFIIQDVKQGHYAIKIPSQQKAYLFNTRNAEENAIELAKYFDTYSIDENLKKLDYTKKESTLKIMQYYLDMSNI